MSKPTKAVSRRDYSEEEITDGLVALAVYGGKATPAARELKRQGKAIPVTTLRDWRNRYEARYLEAREQVRERVWANVSDVWRRAAERGGEATLDAIDHAASATAAGEGKDANTWASAARNLATAGGISNDKAAVIDGRPTERRASEGKSVAELMETLRQRFPELSVAEPIDSTAHEITEGETP